MTENPPIHRLPARSGGPAMLEPLLPGSTCVERFADVPESTMLAAESASVDTADPERRREFGTVRYCARQALRRMGLPAVALLPDADGAPSWPAGVVGSMTHCPGYRAAAVASATDVLGLGIDAEPHAGLPITMLDLILRTEELVQQRILADAYPRLHWDRIVFCAKEAVYKAWFPLTRRWLGFDDVSIGVDPDGAFQARLRVETPPSVGVDLSRLQGWWVVGRGLVVAVTSIDRRVRP